jgi:lysophospholipase L1-like esterase
MPLLRPALAIGIAVLCGCGAGDGPDAGAPARAPAGTTLVAALGDSITEGTPYGKDKSWTATVQRRNPGVTVRNCGISGERTDEIALRLENCARGAHVLVVQGGINDIAQGRPVAEAARDLRAMVRRGKRLGLAVTIVEALPWPNGYPGAVPAVDELNRRIRDLAGDEAVPVVRWHGVLEDPSRHGTMRADLTEDGNHPTPEGHRLLGEAFRLPAGER